MSKTIFNKNKKNIIFLSINKILSFEKKPKDINNLILVLNLQNIFNKYYNKLFFK